jgi:D-alanine-D-alanine ligase
MKKLRVGILFGGRSGEHEVSLLSAASILEAIDKSKYDVVPVGITRQGKWVVAGHAENLLKGNAKQLASSARPDPAGSPGPQSSSHHLRAGDPEATAGAALLAKGEAVIVPPVPSSGDMHELVPFETDAGDRSGPSAIASTPSHELIDVDVIFPVLHGTFGEDGTIQGLLELADIPYVGAGVLGSAAGMDKDVMKRLFIADGLPIVKHVTILREDWRKDAKKARKQIEKSLKYPVFVKPANLGSSVGITKAHGRDELGPSIDHAAEFDRKIVIEEAVGGKKGRAREIECSVLGNDKPEASVPGEIVPSDEFYTYEAKYVSEGSQLVIPAKLNRKQTKQVREMAVRSFQAVDGAGLARVDFLLDPKSQKIYVNEINTMPGFTAISMYPKLWAATGLSYPKLIDRLIQLGLERHEEKKKNKYAK